MNRKNEETCWALTLHLSCYAFKSQFYSQQIPINSSEDTIVKYRFFCSFIPGKDWNWLKLWHTIGVDTKTMPAKFHYCSTIFGDSRGKYVFGASLHSAWPVIRLSFAGSCHRPLMAKITNFCIIRKLGQTSPGSVQWFLYYQNTMTNQPWHKSLNFVLSE